MSPFIRPKAVQQGDRILARAVFLLLLAAYTATFSGLPDNPDAEVEFQTTSSMVRARELALGGTPEAEAILAVQRGDVQGFNVREGAGERAGNHYSWFGIGQALVAVPFYLVGSGLEQTFPDVEERHQSGEHYGAGRSEYFQHLLVGWRNPLLTALTGWLLVLAARRAGARRSSAFWAGLSYGLTTFAWPQARSTLSDVQTTFFVFLGVYLLLRLREELSRMRLPSYTTLLCFGTALGGAFLTRVAAAPAVLVLSVFFLFLLFGPGRPAGRGVRLLLDAGVAFAPALLALGAFLFVNSQRFGDPFETGYGSDVFSGSFFTYSPLRGLAGLTLAPGKGLLWLAPGLLVAVFGVRRALAAGERLLPLLILALAVAIFAPVVVAQAWHGAWTYGPRYVLPWLPVAWLAVGLGLDAMPRLVLGRPAAVALLSLGAITNLPGALVDHMTHQDLALQAARVAWPEVPGETERARDDGRFDRIQWDWRFAAPWAHWRIFRHRIAGLGEEFPVREVFFLEDERHVKPTHPRDRGFRHIAWVDLHERLGGPRWPGLLLCVALAAWGFGAAISGFDPTQA